MNVAFANSYLLPFAVLVAVPVILHLYARAKPPEYRFSSVEFLRRVLRKSVRIRQPQSWLVMILRACLYAALLGAFLHPLIFQGPPMAGIGGRRNVVLIVDSTASMAASAGNQTRFARACSQGAEVLAGLRSGDRANIIWLGSPLRAEFPELGVNFAYLQKALREATSALGVGNVESALSMAEEMLRDQEGADEIYLLSDFQTGTWKDVEPKIASSRRLFLVDVGSATAPNLAVSGLSIEPANPLAGEDLTVRAEVSAFAGEPRRATVFLRLGETRQSAEVRVEPGATATALFRVSAGEAGERSVSASVEDEHFPYDNERWLAFAVGNHLQIGVHSGATGAAGFWQRALRAIDWARSTPLTEASWSRLDDFDLLMLAGWRGDVGREELTAYLANGGAVVWLPDSQTPASLLQELAGIRSAIRRDRSESGWSLRIADREHPAIRIFNDGDNGDPTRGSFSERIGLDSDLSAALKPILEFTDGRPALAACRKAPGVLLWNLPLSRDISDWALQPEFLPLIGELVLHHRRQSTDSTVRNLLPGQVLARGFSTDTLVEDVELLHGAKPVALDHRRDRADLLFAAQDAVRPGVYTWRHRGQIIASQTQNFPPSESDLAAVPPPEVNATVHHAGTGAATLRELREGTPIWKQLLVLGLVLFVFEALAVMKLDHVAAQRGAATEAT